MNSQDNKILKFDEIVTPERIRFSNDSDLASTIARMKTRMSDAYAEEDMFKVVLCEDAICSIKMLQQVYNN